MRFARGAGPGGGARSCLVLLVVCAVASAALALVSPRPAHAQAGALRQVGVFHRPEGAGGRANGELLFRSSTRRVYQAIRTGETTITEYDADTLKATRVAKLPQLAVTLTAIGESAWLWTLDDANGRLFSIVRTDGFGAFEYSLVSLDLGTFHASPRRLLYDLGRRSPLAISYHAGSDRIYMLSKLEISLGRDVVFLEERRPDGSLVWEHPVLPCASIGDHLLAPIVARSVLDPTRIFLNCYMRNGSQSQVVRVTLGSDERVAGEETFPSVPRSISGVAFDPGSDRIFFLATNSNAGRGVWVFDGRAGRFLGVIASGDTREGEDDYAMGLDPTSGRIYIQTPAGFLVSDGRRTPLDAGYIFRELAGPGRAPIHVDSGSRRVFAPDPKWPPGDGWPRRYLILADEIPAARGLQPADPDANTLDVDERPGYTDATFAGSARAYAIRSLTTGGVQRALWNSTLTDFEPKHIPFLWPGIQSLPLSQANRELVAARVLDVELSAAAAEARAVGGAADDGTRADLAGAGGSWPYQAAECDNAAAPASRREQAGASVVCDAAAARAAADAAAATLSLPTAAGLVAAEAAWSRGGVRRDAALGLVATAAAGVRGLSLFDRVRIGELWVTAAAQARGRKGTARAAYVRHIADAWVDEDGDGDADYFCAQCDPTEVLVHVNRALAGFASVSMPSPDGAYYPEGSPGGYQAIVRRDIFESFAARSLNDDDTHEVPGFEIVIYSDGRAGRTRHVLQIAGVEAEAHYGIFVLPGALPPPVIEPPLAVLQPAPAPPPPVVDPQPAAPAAASTVVERIARRIAEGYGVALARPADAGLIASLLVFMSLPGYLLWRRRLKVRAA